MTGKALVIFQGFPGAVGTLHEPQNGPWSNKKKITKITFLAASMKNVPPRKVK